MTFDDMTPAALIARAKELNRRFCDLSAEVSLLRAQLLAAARQARQASAIENQRPSNVDDVPPPQPPPTIWRFGPDPDAPNGDD